MLPHGGNPVQQKVGGEVEMDVLKWLSLPADGW